MRRARRRQPSFCRVGRVPGEASAGLPGEVGVFWGAGLRRSGVLGGLPGGGVSAAGVVAWVVGESWWDSANLAFSQASWDSTRAFCLSSSSRLIDMAGERSGAAGFFK